MTSSSDADQAGKLTLGYFEPNPHLRQPLTRIETARAVVRLAVDRSAESASRSEPTQDFLVVQHEPDRICFAVTDGVGSSFRGDRAAEMLARLVTGWMFGRPPPRSESELRDELTDYLKWIAKKFHPMILKLGIPGRPNSLVREVLEEKRKYGSEAMLACGRIDWPEEGPAQVALAWLGDACLRVVAPDGSELDLTGSTADRWSTRLGPRGRVQTRVMSADEAARVIACSDGVLAGLSSVVRLSDAELEPVLAGLAAKASSDDTALVDIALDTSAMPPVDTPADEGGTEEAFAPEEDEGAEGEGVEDENADEEVVDGPEPPEWHLTEGVLRWTSTTGAVGYHLQIGEDLGFQNPIDYHLLTTTAFVLPQLPGSTSWVRLRALAAAQPGRWGDRRMIENPLVEHTIEPKSRQLRFEVSRYRAVAKPPRDVKVDYDQEHSLLHLRWTAVRGAKTYHVQLVDDEGRLKIVPFRRNEAQVEVHQEYSVYLRSAGTDWESAWLHVGDVRTYRQ
ncbi:protein phosphatase 2C domain-containing protein [Lentzea sp. JNUCC 0626]|uniref:protein phosphatase 2C domain-containing protein n=1 Tax=Lentzea sp. JNUCC 0626 TaxID=3367513 RepID=UPI003748410D